MIDIETIITLNIAENDGGKILSPEDYKLSKNKFLKREYNGLKAHVKYASAVLIRDNRPVKVHFVFTDKNEINAYVSRLRMFTDPQYLIVCYSGIFTYTQCLFLWLLSSPNILPQIGKAKRRVLDFSQLSNLFIKEKRIELAKLSVHYVLVGPDKIDHLTKDIRNEYALLLTSFAIEFLFFHEMSHIDHGHVDYLKNKNAAFDVLYNTESGQNINIQVFDKIKGIENEADLGSAEFLFDSYWGLEYKGTLMKKFSRLLKTNEDLLFTLFYSLIWLFHIIQEYRITHGVIIVTSHPTPECRILSVFRIFYVLAEKKNGNPDMVYEQFIKATREYLATCEVIQIDPYVTPNIFYKNSSAEQELIQVENLRLEMLKEMKPYQFSRKN